jgi:hypothetical protein
MTDMASLAPEAARPGHATRPAACPNCGTPFEHAAAAPRYCPHCGQQTTLHPPSIAEFVHEFVGHYVAFEGPLWTSLRLLLLHPGKLTREYLEGRRRRYVLPLRLYLSASFLFFLAFRFLSGYEGPTFTAVPPSTKAAHAASAPAASAAAGGDHERTVIVTPRGIEIASGARATAATQEAFDTVPCGDTASRPCNWFERRSIEASRRWVADPKKEAAAFGGRWLHIAPYAVFLMLPVFSAILALAYRNRRMLFGEHLVFSLHTHALWYLVGLVAVLSLYSLATWLFLAMGPYMVMALRTVYGGRWWATILRATAILMAYSILLGLVSTVLGLALFIE